MLDFNTMVSGDSRSLRNFFNDLCDSLEKAESRMEDVEAMESKLDEAIGIEEHRDELVELVRHLEEELETKDKLILELREQLKSKGKTSKKATDDVIEVPKIPVKKKKIIKRVTRL